MKTRPIYIRESPAIVPNVTSMPEAIEQASEARARERINANMKRIQEGAGAILKAKGFSNPIAVLSIGELDEQALFAREAFIHASAALKYFGESNLVAALDWSLAAGDEFAKARAEPAQRITALLRQRTTETARRVREVAAVGEEFRAKRGRLPKMGRASDFDEVAQMLRARGEPDFPTPGAFRVWKNKLKLGYPW